METPCFTRLAMMAAHLLLLFAVQGARSSVQEIEHDGEVTGASGGVATLRCVYKGSRTVTLIVWYKEGGGGPVDIASCQDGKTNINVSFSPRLTFPGGSNTDGSISISALRSSDIGTYICRFVLNSGNKEASIKLTVLVGPEVSLKLGPRPLVSGQSGPQLVATCLAANGNPAASISWTMKSISGIDFASDILNGTKNRISSTGGGLFNVSEALKLTPTKEMNEATLTCVVKQPGIDTPIKKDVTLDVHCARSSVQEIEHDGEVTGASGGVATLRCVYKGSQTVIQIVWYKEGGGGPVYIANRQDGKTDINGSFSSRLTFPGGSNTDGSISISALRSSDIGTYICRFVLNSGNKEASIKLTVLAGGDGVCIAVAAILLLMTLAAAVGAIYFYKKGRVLVWKNKGENDVQMAPHTTQRHSDNGGLVSGRATQETELYENLPKEISSHQNRLKKPGSEN